MIGRNSASTLARSVRCAGFSYREGRNFLEGPPFTSGFFRIQPALFSDDSPIQSVVSKLGQDDPISILHLQHGTIALELTYSRWLFCTCNMNNRIELTYSSGRNPPQCWSGHVSYPSHTWHSPACPCGMPGDGTVCDRGFGLLIEQNGARSSNVLCQATPLRLWLLWLCSYFTPSRYGPSVGRASRIEVDPLSS